MGMSYIPLSTSPGIYNDGNKQDTLTALDNHLSCNITSIRPTAEDHMLLIFNRHHSLWEDMRNHHLLNYTISYHYSVRRRFSTPRITPTYDDYYDTKTKAIQLKQVWIYVFLCVV